MSGSNFTVYQDTSGISYRGAKMIEYLLVLEDTHVDF